LEVLFVAKTKKVASYLTLIFGLCVADNTMSLQNLLKSRMIVSSFITLVACLIDGIEFVSQARSICDQETQWTNAITGI